MGQTIIDKLWAEHTVADLGDGATLLYIDRIFLHERTGSVGAPSTNGSWPEV